MNNILTVIGGGVVVIILVVLIAGITSFITLWAWNAVMPVVFHLPHINLIEAFALNLLASKLTSTVTNKK